MANWKHVPPSHLRRRELLFALWRNPPHTIYQALAINFLEARFATLLPPERLGYGKPTARIARIAD